MSDQPSIRDLNKLLFFSDKLSNVHVENLKTFPFIYFNGVTEAKLEHDISVKKELPSTVYYDLTTDQENNFPEKRYSALESAVRSLFWKEVKVKIAINGKEVFKSE